MRLLLISHAFAPSIGGIETVSDTVAREWIKAGHDVTVITQTPAVDDTDVDYPFPIVRQPGPLALLRWHRWADIVIHNNISLRLGWPLHLVRRPWIVVHQTHLRRPDGTLDRADRAKRRALRRAHSIAISQYIANDLPVPARIVGNPYRADMFEPFRPLAERPFDLVFAGRLVSDKGVDLLLTALASITDRRWRLMIIGSGPEEDNLRRQASELMINNRIVFMGPMNSADVAGAMNQARILVVPSRWAEPFGVVALEGMACGCFVIGSSGGGLPEAIGPGGLTFANNDAADLARKLRWALDDDALRAQARDAAPAHLRRFAPDAVAQAWLEDIVHG